jgi:thymidylate synthase ThyX
MNRLLTGDFHRVRIIDDLAPEDLAMLQALLSRSNADLEEHLDRLRATGSGKFMQSYYVGYKHKSIADGGSTTIFFDHVSLLAAKAIQDWALYCGQETSTRFIDMAQQPICDPIGSEASSEIMGDWMAFYEASQAEVAAEVMRRHPIREGEEPAKYQAAVKARTFDILRGFLPAGVMTQLSWHTNLRQAADHLVTLENHPLPEVRAIGRDARQRLAFKYPSSGFTTSMPTVTGASRTLEDLSAQAAWEARVARETAYLDESSFYSGTPWIEVARHRGFSSRERALLADRPRGCAIPRIFGQCGNVVGWGRLDFGSFRDVQRHRPGIITMPLLTATMGFEPWYLAQLSTSHADRAVALINRQLDRIEALTQDVGLRQYFYPLGMRVGFQLAFPIPAFVYLLEVRSSKTVHATLRKLTHTFAESFVEQMRDIPIHVDWDEDDWTLRRGQQTITAKVET